MIREGKQDILLGSIKSEYYKICCNINNFIIEHNNKFKIKDYKILLIPYETLMYFHKDKTI